jgi:hypothetical protein
LALTHDVATVAKTAKKLLESEQKAWEEKFPQLLATAAAPPPAPQQAPGAFFTNPSVRRLTIRIDSIEQESDPEIRTIRVRKSGVSDLPLLKEDATDTDVTLYGSQLTQYLTLSSETIDVEKWDQHLLYGLIQHPTACQTVETAMAADISGEGSLRYLVGLAALLEGFGVTPEKLQLARAQLHSIRMGASESAAEYYSRYTRARLEAHGGQSDPLDQQGVMHFRLSLLPNIATLCANFYYLDPLDTGTIGTPYIYVRNWQQLRDAFLLKDRSLLHSSRQQDVEAGLTAFQKLFENGFQTVFDQNL